MARTNKLITALLGFNVTGDFGPMTFYRNSRGKIVWFPRVPALNPASEIQQIMRERFSQVARDWRSLTDDQRHAWLHTSKCCGLLITGYNLYLYWRTTRDLPVIQTIERQCHVTLFLGP